MKLIKPYTVAALDKITQTVGDDKHAIEGVLAKALPLLTEPDVELNNWYPNTPDDAAGFRVYHEAATRLHVGKEIALALLIDEPADPPTMKGASRMPAGIIFIPEVGGPQPKQLAVKAGDPVVFVAKGSAARSFTALDKSWTTGPVFSPDGMPSVTYQRVFPTPGTYRYRDDTTPLITGEIHVL